jgi:3-phenylpropionate/cinnamic acid dioxygenase small subunit
MASPKEVAVETDLAVRRLLARYCHLVDDGDLDAAAALFTDDARVRAGAEDYAGRDAIKGWLVEVPHGQFHQVTNVVVSNGSQPGIVHAVSDLMTGTRDGNGWTGFGLGRYHDTITGQGRNMRFTQRLYTVR